MCHACVIESVKKTMLSRRSLFSGAAAAGLATTAGTLLPRQAAAQTALAGGRVVDLTHVFDEDFPTFDGNPGIVYERDKDIAKDGYNICRH